MVRFKLETSVNQFAVAAALAALSDREHLERERALNREARTYTRRLFESAGFSVTPSETNFVLVDLRQNPRAFRDTCRQFGVLVGRPFPPLDTSVRISIGTLDEMQRAAEVFRRAGNF
jgi:histidinol-phosphate aminotransferase